MGLEAALWTIAATFVSGLQVFLQKVIAREGRSSGLNGAFMYAGPIIVACVALPFVGVPISWEMAALFACVSGVTYAIGNYLRIEGFKYIDTVIFLPLNKVFGPLIVLVGSILFLGESLSWLQYLGVAISITVPLLLVSSSEKHRQNNLKLGLVFLAVSTVLVAASQIVIKPGLTLDPSVFFVMGIAQITAFILSVGIHVHTHTDESHFSSLFKRRDWELGAIMAAMSAIAFYSLLKAMSLGQLSLVYTIHAHYILIPIILSVWWYGEHINARKLFAVVVSFVAIGLLI